MTPPPTVDELLEAKTERQRLQRIEERLAALALPPAHPAHLPRRNPQEEDGANCIAFALTVRRLRMLYEMARSGALARYAGRLDGPLRDAMLSMQPPLLQILRDGSAEWALFELGQRLLLIGQANR